MTAVSRESAPQAAVARRGPVMSPVWEAHTATAARARDTVEGTPVTAALGVSRHLEVAVSTLHRVPVPVPVQAPVRVLFQPPTPTG